MLPPGVMVLAVEVSAVVVVAVDIQGFVLRKTARLPLAWPTSSSGKPLPSRSAAATVTGRCPRARIVSVRVPSPLPSNTSV